jgi:hypothetical protein
MTSTTRVGTKILALQAGGSWLSPEWAGRNYDAAEGTES